METFQQNVYLGYVVETQTFQQNVYLGYVVHNKSRSKL